MDPQTNEPPDVETSLRWGWSLGLLVALCAPENTTRAQDTVPLLVRVQDTIPLLVRVEDRTRVGPRNRVVARNPVNGVDRDVYRSDGHIPYEVTLSPEGRYLAFIEVVGKAEAGGQRVTVIDRAGQIVSLLGASSLYARRGVREYVWCCGPDTLAIITGGLADEGGGGESTTLPYGLSLVDVRTGLATPIEGVRFPLQINWAPFDSSLYIKDSPQNKSGERGSVAFPVYRYHVPTRTLSTTTRRGVFFSPDGKYYFDRGIGEGSRSLTLYRAVDDEDVTRQLALPRDQVGPGGGWVAGAPHALAFTEKPAPQTPKPTQRERRFGGARSRTPQLNTDRWNVILDAETGQVIDRFQGDIGVGWKTNAPALPVERRTGVELIPLRRP